MKKELEEEKKERAEAEGTLREMVESLNELPTEVLDQLATNLERIEAYNKKHHLHTGSSQGAYATAALEELWELNPSFISLCLLNEHIKTRMVLDLAPLEAIMLIETEEDLKEWTGDEEWIDSIGNITSKEITRKDGYAVATFINDWGLHAKLYLISIDSIRSSLPVEIANDLKNGCRVSVHRADFDSGFFLSLVE